MREFGLKTCDSGVKRDLGVCNMGQRKYDLWELEVGVGLAATAG